MQRTDTDGDVMQATSNCAPTEPGVTLRRHTVRAAISVAEHAADESNLRLREAEQQRDDLARRLGEMQRKVDVLLAERENRTRHVRDLLAAVS